MTVTPQQLQSMKQRAITLLQGNQLVDAKSLLVQITRQAPGDWEAWHLLSAVHGMSGDMTEAEAASHRVIALQPSLTGAHINLGNALMAQGKHDEAEASFRRALRLQPNEAQALNNLGNLLKIRGKPAEAEMHYRDALKHAPNYPDAHSNLGIVLQDQGKLDDALACYQRAIQLQPDHADAHFNIGHALLAKGQPEAAAACYQKLTLMRPGDAKAWLMLGSTLDQLRKYDQAIASYQRSIELQPDYAEAYCSLGSALQHSGHMGKAEDMYREALRLKPHMMNARYFLAALGAESTPGQSPSEYVTGLFDDYAERFDQHLVHDLEYKTPVLLSQLVRKSLPKEQVGLDVLDLGCGTGLGGAMFRNVARRLVGIDLSPKMIAKARQRNIYDELMVGDVLEPMMKSNVSFHLIIATDVFVYIGDLSQVFHAVKTVLCPGGLFAFSTEVEDANGTFVLRASGRYAHTKEYIRDLSRNTGLVEADISRVILRKEAGESIEGNIFVLRQAD